VGGLPRLGAEALKPVPQDVLDVVRRLRGAGHEALLVGGCVRDALLGRTAKDFDVATSARPEEVESIFERSHAVGRRFGVVLVVLEGEPIEVATFRTDADYSDGRRPASVVFSGIEEDAARRDFTINALYLDPLEDRVVDPLGVRGDLDARLLRTVGDPGARFREDHLRLLRAVRLAATLDFTLEPRTLASIRDHAELAGSVSGERIREELRLLLVHPRRAGGIRLMQEAGLLRVVLPEVDAMRGVAQPPEYHPEGDVYVHTLLALDHLPGEPSFALALATLLHDVGKPPTYEEAEDRIRFHGHADLGARMARQISLRLRLSREEKDRVVWLVDKHLVFLEAHRMRRATMRRYLDHEGFDDLHALHRADVLAANGDLTHWSIVEDARREFEATPARPQPLVTGRDLIDMGLTPGPAFKGILDAVEEAQLEDRLEDREAALEMARDLARQRGLSPRDPQDG
jgi:poly(A) polymerase